MDTSNLELTEEAVKYLDSLEPAERDAYYRTLQARKNLPPAETLESLTERLAELGKIRNQDRVERQKVSAEIDKRLILKAETKLALFISDEIEKGVVNIGDIKMKARDLGLPHVDVTSQINEVVRLRQYFEEKEAKRQQAGSNNIAKKKDEFFG